MSNRVMEAVAWGRVCMSAPKSRRCTARGVWTGSKYGWVGANIPGPLEAAIASSPMKKSKSSVPRFMERWLAGPAPPVRNEGLFPTAGRPEPVPPLPPVGPLLAMAVGKTKEGESLPAKPKDRQSTRLVQADEQAGYRTGKMIRARMGSNGENEVRGPGKGKERSSHRA